MTITLESSRATRLRARLLQLRLTTVTLVFFFFFTMFTFLPEYKWVEPYIIPLNLLEEELFKETTPSIVHSNKIACEYKDVFNRNESLFGREFTVPTGSTFAIAMLTRTDYTNRKTTDEQVQSATTKSNHIQSCCLVPSVGESAFGESERKNKLTSYLVADCTDNELNFDDFSPAGIINGSFAPKNCTPQISVAILVTYRNRRTHLVVFLPYIHNFLRKQNIHYKIFLIEQQNEKPWNKGLLYNIGAIFAIAEKFPCLILHDIDLLPLDDGNLYACLRKSPRHLSSNIDKMGYVLPYAQLLGGVLAIRSDHYVSVNGFSHRFLNWGAEDDDFYDRLTQVGLNILRLPFEVSRYKMLPHIPQSRNRLAKKIRVANRQERSLGEWKDGLSSIPNGGVKVTQHRLFTLIGVK